ncbi:centrosomal protein of 72 kDa-like isoform X1 [Stegostoma tigrinum]|uniref:centrosomal protein of 72 kDa-like isoform X1 n=1 Tax=Stegostoma tigrinum TaxID=3053191 RepID=UPI00202B7041|nr:centrosomal protein of 72 kDa-like isoform X1 [Stegostoma tigrinum]
MAAVELEATEEWIRDKVQLNNQRLDEVEFLSLQGTYSDKISCLGDAFLNFRRLKSLDLSRNSIVSLGGLENLHSLEKLNLYYNNVPSSKEISSLRHLTNLKELDLRLNPVTRNEENYRLYIIHLLPSLKKLDDRPVRDSERKAAQIQFVSSEQKEEADLDREEERNYIKKNFAYEKDEQNSVHSSIKYKWDGASDLKVDLKERWAPHDFQLSSDRQESLSCRPSLSSVYSGRDLREARENDTSSKMGIDTMEVEPSRSGQYHSYLEEDDNKTYHSPSRSSLRPVGKSVCNRPREGFRVTFSDKILDSNTDESSIQKNFINSDLQYDSSSGYNKKESLLQTRERNHTKYTDISVKDSLANIDVNNFLSYDYHKQSNMDTKTYQSTLEPQNSYLHRQTDKPSIGTHNDRSFTTNSDLKTSSTYGIRKNTYVDDGASSQRSKMTSSGLIPRHGTSTSDHLLDRQSLVSPASSFTSLYSNSSKRGFIEHMSTEFTTNKNLERRSQLTTANVENFESKLEPKKTSSLSSLSCIQPSYDRKQTALNKLHEVEECGDYRSRTPVGLSCSFSASVSSLLLNLLDLVDQHWNGLRSLQSNQRFLTPAHELLSNLVNSVSVPKIQSLEKKVKALTEENKSLLTRTGFGLDTAELQRVKHQLTQKQDDLESLRGRLAKVLDENNKLRSQLTSLELANCAGNQLQNKDLQKDNERLTLEVEYLNQQIKQYSKLQETVTMLQESHRSLVSTNNYLQQQLNVNSAGQNNDAPYHLNSHRMKAWSKLPPSEITELPLSSKRSYHSTSDIL